MTCIYVSANWGREFYFSKVLDIVSATLSVISDTSGYVNVSIPGAKVEYTRNIIKGVTPIGINQRFDNTTKRGILITSSVDISVEVLMSVTAYGDRYSSSTFYSHQTLLLLPAQVLSSEYLITPTKGTTNVVVVGTQNSTSVTISYRYSKDTVDLDMLDIYNASSTRDLTGTVIKSSNPVAVFTLSYTTYSYYGGVQKMQYAQQVSSASRRFVFVIPQFYVSLRTSDASRTDCCLTAFALEDNTLVKTFTDSYPGTMFLNGGQYAKTGGFKDYFILTGSKPISVIYENSNKLIRTQIPAVSQYMNSYSFSVPSLAYNQYVYLIIVVPTYYKGGITFTGKTIPPLVKTVSTIVNGVQYTIAYYRLEDAGYHHVFHSNPIVTFGAFVYRQDDHFFHDK